MVSGKEILKALSLVMDPDLGRDIVSLGFIKDLAVSESSVSFSIELTTPACPMKQRIRDEAERAVSAVKGVEKVEIKMTARVRSAPQGPDKAMVPGVRNIVAVASGKGGVGKSTVSVNLAIALAARGARVGLMDADIYGPSIPLIMGISSEPGVEGEKVIPVEKFGVKVISMAFFMKGDEAVVWRGPMLHRAVSQFLGGVDWGELDYLIVDLPPGTGDIALSLCTLVPVTGAVVVSTPQDMALNVAQKAIAMFGVLKCGIVGIVENMSHYICPGCGRREDIFGTGGARAAAEKRGIPFLGEIPLSTALRRACDEGLPEVSVLAESDWGKAFSAIAGNVASRISVINSSERAPASAGGK